MPKGKALFFCASVLLLLIISSREAAAQNRALIISSDVFSSYAQTQNTASGNADKIAAVFQDSLEPFKVITVLSDVIASKATFDEAVNTTFSDAVDGDISYLYFSAHGFLQDDEAYLLLGDGENEYRLSPKALEKSLKNISGKKVIIIDACHSGAFIGKGSDSMAVSHAFTGEDYKVLTSSGSAEESWYWQANAQGGALSTGSGYFSDILALGLSARGGFAADLNSDGYITLKECDAYLLNSHGVSAPRVYPENDDFVLFTYDRNRYLTEYNLPDGDLGGLTFEKDVLSYTDPIVTFEFTAHRPIKVAYQLVYFKNNRWDFDHAHLIYDNFESGGIYGDEKGAVSPGRKVRSLQLELQGDDTFGYVMLQIFTMTDGIPTLHFSRVLAVPRMGGSPGLNVTTPASFVPAQGEEQPILIAHTSPIEYSVAVQDAQGNTVYRLKTHSGTRPEQPASGCSLLYWNGSMRDGTLAPCGSYRICVTAYYPQESYTAYSQFFTLLAPE